MTSYALILCLALALNIRSRPMLALSLVVGAGIFMPIADSAFYWRCIAVECMVMLAAYRINVPASIIIIRISVLLCAFHVIGLLLDGYPKTSPYHVIVRFLEHAELVACILFSRPISARWLHVRPR